MEHRGRSGRSKWKKLPLREWPFWFAECPHVFAINRQVLCETVAVLMRRPLNIAPVQGMRPQNDEWANASIVWPMARLFKLYEMVSYGQRLYITPKIVVHAPDVLVGFLWTPLREVLMMVRERMVYEHLRIKIKHGPGEIMELLGPEAAKVMVGKGFPDTLVVRSSQWAWYDLSLGVNKSGCLDFC